MTALLTVDNLRCRYESQLAVDGAGFELAEGALASLIGPSGCGKTTVLRAIAGFQPLLAGTITLAGACISSPGHRLPPERRGLSMVFQDHALFPHLTVARNVAAGLFRLDAAAAREITARMLENVRLGSLAQRYPHELSGGQQQRVALARALAPNPRLLLMDEPFSNLDPSLREDLCQEVRGLLKSMGTTCLMVTHDQQDAFIFSDTAGVMNAGRIEQWGNPYDLYHEPATPFVANFVGDGVFLDATILDGNRIDSELAELHGDLGAGAVPGKPIHLLVRPDDIIHDDASERTARVLKKTFRGESYLYTLELPSGSRILSLVPSHHDHAVGSDLGIRLAIDHLVYFDR